MNIEDLGFTKEELQEKVIDTIADKLLFSLSSDEDGGEHSAPSRLQKKLEEVIKKRVDDAVAAIADKHILPNAATYIENFVLQRTSQWGEKKGEPVTFVQYMAQRAEEYMREDVDSYGKGKNDQGGSSFYAKSTRLAFMIDKHLHYTIETSMKDAVGIVQGAIVPALSEVVRAKLAEISNGMTVIVGVKK